MQDAFYLQHTGWDDWFKYSTRYYLEYIDAAGHAHDIGLTKVGRFGLLPARGGGETPPGARYPDPPRKFKTLSSEFFSLGEDPEFYENLTKLGGDVRDKVLAALRDIAYDQELLPLAAAEDVTKVSLLRSVPLLTVRDQYHRLAHGGLKLTPFDLRFRLNYVKNGPKPSIQFHVVPEQLPPTNIHVIIGRNGVGKSHFLNVLARHMVNRNPKKTTGTADDLESVTSAEIVNLVSVSFSAFDSFEPLSVPQDRSGLTYHYVGLKKRRTKQEEPDAIKGPKALAGEMTQSSRICFEGTRKSRWLRGLRLLEADPIFRSIGIADAVETAATIDEALDHIAPAFKLLSSGHKIVLLTITKLVETVEEKSLVLLDEPEAHLHPPLLSAFVRALSDLLINRNGVAIVATHSPVVLQEVPRACAWKINRVGNLTTVDRPYLETFGENVGTLTNEVFGLEVVATGFHRLLWEAAEAKRDYEGALGVFEGKVGTEGKAILRAMTNALGSASVER